MVEVLRILLLVYKIMRDESDGQSEHKRWSEGGRQTVYQAQLFGGWELPFVLSTGTVV